MEPHELIPPSLDEPPIDTEGLRARVHIRAGFLAKRRARRARIGGAGALALVMVVGIAIAGISSGPTQKLQTGKGADTTTTSRSIGLRTTTTFEGTTTTASASTSSSAPSSASSTTPPWPGPTTTIADRPSSTIAPLTPKATTTTTVPPNHGVCGRPLGGAAANGLRIELDVAKTGESTVSGTATITNLGPGAARLTLYRDLWVSGVDAEGYLVTQVWIGGPERFVDLAEGESVSNPAASVDGPCGNNQPATTWVVRVVGERDGKSFDVMSPPVRAR